MSKPITDFIAKSAMPKSYYEEFGKLLRSNANVFGTGPCDVYKVGDWVFICHDNYLKPLVWRIHFSDWQDTDKSAM